MAQCPHKQSLSQQFIQRENFIYSIILKNQIKKKKLINSLLAFLTLISSRMFFAMQNPLRLFCGVLYFNQNDKAGVSNQKVLTIFVLVNKRILWSNVFTIIDRLR